MTRGFTLIELVLVGAIILIIASLSVGAFSQFNKRISLEKDAEKVTSLIHKAESNTLAGRLGLQYGVHFESKKAVMFAGDVYVSAAATNETVVFSPLVTASSISLLGGGSDIVFKRLIGSTDQSGFVNLSIVGTPAVTRRINISANGVVNIQ